ncbi:MAG: TraB/GumN family protein [Candidatus Moranbacteria bacterium]|nr:TraB/GumN family protein [Candidatus Moranbacteria bacterium]NTW89527.1 TraB/GumN family protein [Candidatus Moranbacteria bacterium]
MERFPFPSIEHIPTTSERVTGHSREFDRESESKRKFPSEQIRSNMETRHWKIGASDINAIGTMHVPETFLEFRSEIESAIRESDIVVVEYAPEAQGMYDRDTASHLSAIPSPSNPAYNLEQVRQTAIGHEREWNIGIFHHELELLAAKYGKDLACADLNYSMDPEEYLKESEMDQQAVEEDAAESAKLKRLGLYGAAAAAGATALGMGKKTEAASNMSRRNFLRLGLLAGAGLIFGVTPKLTETPKRSERTDDGPTPESISEEMRWNALRDAHIADALHRLADAGYKKITLIYGTAHIKFIEQNLLQRERSKNVMKAGESLVKKRNPDSFRVYELEDGPNDSEKFVADPHKVWRRKRVP